MIRDDQHLLELTDAFHAAALNPGGWHEALEGLAEATGSSHGQLIGIGSNAAVPFDVITGIDSDFHQEFIDAGGGDPRINPRVDAGMRAPVLKVMAESDFMTSEEHKRHPHYQEFAIPWDVPYICLTTLDRNDGMLIGLAVVRTKREGHITNAQREVFRTLASHVRAAVRMQLAFEGEGSALLVGAMDALSMPAFVCDRNGCVRAMTPAAEELLDADQGLRLQLGRFRTTSPSDEKALKDAIAAAARAPSPVDRPVLQTVIVRDGPRGAPPIVLDVISLPSRLLEFSFAPRVLVLARAERRSDESRAILRAAYSLTPAEADVAIHVSTGTTAEAIADARGVAVGTVRIQIKSVLAKVGVKRQVELAARVNQL